MSAAPSRLRERSGSLGVNPPGSHETIVHYEELKNLNVEEGADDRKLSKWILFSFSAPSIPLALAALPMVVYLPVIYADSDGFGLSLGVVGTLIMLSRISDVITDPIIGFLSDRTRTRWGRRKPFIALGMPIYGIGMWLLFIPPIEFTPMSFLGWEFSTGYVWMFAIMTLLYLGSTIMYLPLSAWGAELSATYSGRTLVMSWREAMGLVGGSYSAFVPLILLFFGYTKPTDATLVLIVSMCVIMPIFVINQLISVPEWPVVEREKDRIKLVDGLKVVAKNKPYVLLVIVFTFSTIGASMTSGLSFFFVKHVLLSGELYGVYIAPYFLSQIVALPLWFKLSGRIGKHRAMMVAIGWYALWCCFIPIIATTSDELFQSLAIGKLPGKFVIFMIVMCLKGSALGALGALPSAMAADVVDVDTATTGKQRAGAYFSIWSMITKGAYALGIAIGLHLVVFWGFDSLADPLDTTNSDFSLFMLACTYSIIPATFSLVGVPLLWKYPLTEEKVAEVQAEIAAKNRAAELGDHE